MPAERVTESLDEIREELSTLAVDHAPREAPEGRERDLLGLLAFALVFARRQKTVRFPVTLDWTRPGFDVVDQVLTVRVQYARLDGLADLASTLREQGASARDRDGLVVLALDALDAEFKEFQLGHALYGDVTLFAFRVRIPESADARIRHAREHGWVPTLKEHNLIPGRGLVVEDGKHGFLLTLPESEELSGVATLLPDGAFYPCWNPFARQGRNEDDLQYWLQWGQGQAASEWRDVLKVGDVPATTNSRTEE